MTIFVHFLQEQILAFGEIPFVHFTFYVTYYKCHCYFGNKAALLTILNDLVRNSTCLGMTMMSVLLLEYNTKLLALILLFFSQM